VKSHILRIGIVDNSDRLHAVSFTTGVNVITGKSSTGKSAMIEICDYCFGSAEFTVPDGVITQNSQIYFVVVRVGETTLVLARKPESKDAFLKEDSDDKITSNTYEFTMSYFADPYFMPLADFKKELGRYFGLVITDVDESGARKAYTGKKSPTPSVRSFASFIFQHQNLLANKHAIFYRFDEREKRDQVIEHFRIFVGYADQDYFVRSQELNGLKGQARALEQQIPRAADVRKKAADQLEQALAEYSATGGGNLDLGDLPSILRNPMRALEKSRTLQATVNSLSEEHVRQREQFERDKARLISELRKRQNTLSGINSSIRFTKGYISEAASVRVPSSAEINVSICPFCGSTHNEVEEEGNKLRDAIDWLNRELERSPYLLDSFEEDRKQVQDEIEEFREHIGGLERRIATLDTQITDLDQYRTQSELTLRAKWQVEAILEELATQKDSRLVRDLANLNKEITRLSEYLKEYYDIDSKLKAAEQYIRAEMSTIGNRFDFEESFRPINLRFSLETFDLWHETQDGRKIFLRSMGSGANWLYCHLTLFLALQNYFCRRGDACSIPTILFLDQPSQVYFPDIVDNAPDFEPETLAQLEGASRKRSVDDDIRAVESLYSQLVRFCNETREKTGIEPQLIVTDHADHLQLDVDVDFDSLVRARWRTRGFIEIGDDEN
jgi:hypothetical protein